MGAVAPTAGAIAVHIAQAAPVPTACTLYASPTGSDAGNGSAAQPYLTVKKVADALAPGAVGCLATGVYQLPMEVSGVNGKPVPVLNLTHGGTAVAPATLRNAPGADARIVGRLVIGTSATYLTIAGLTLDGGPTLDDEASSVTVLATGASLIGNNITAPTRTCVSVGLYGSSMITPSAINIEGNRIHHCGDDKGWGKPRDGYAHNQEHGVYVESARGTTIRHNLIDHNDARGVQLFADADGTLVQNNTIDSNTTGLLVGGWGSYGRSDSNVVSANLITNSSRFAVDVNWSGTPMPTGPQMTTVTDNCMFGVNAATMVAAYSGLSWNANVWTNPQFNGLSTGDYRLKATSPCLGKGIRPTLGAVAVVATRTSVTSTAIVSPHRMTAVSSMRVRLCSNSTCTGTFGPWLSTNEVSAVDVTDVKVAATMVGLLPGRAYQVQWLTRQALLSATQSVAINVTTPVTVATAR